MATTRRMSGSGRSSDADTGVADTAHDNPRANDHSGDTKPAGKRKPGTLWTTTPEKKKCIEDLKSSPTTMPFIDFWKPFEPFVRMICNAKGLRAHEIGDVLADVKLAVLANIKTYDDHKGRFHAWLGTITRNKIMDVLRKRIPHEQRHIQIGDGSDFDWISGNRHVKGDTTCKQEAKSSSESKRGQPTTTDTTDTAMANLRDERGIVVKTKPATPDTLVCVGEEQHIAKALLKKVASRVSPKQWQIFEAVVVRQITVAKVCKALEVTENQVYIARNRVGKVYNEELDAVGREIGRDLQQYRLEKSERPKTPVKPKTSRSAK